MWLDLFAVTEVPYNIFMSSAWTGAMSIEDSANTYGFSGGSLFFFTGLSRTCAFSVHSTKVSSIVLNPSAEGVPFSSLGQLFFYDFTDSLVYTFSMLIVVVCFSGFPVFSDALFTPAEVEDPLSKDNVYKSVSALAFPFYVVPAAMAPCFMQVPDSTVL